MKCLDCGAEMEEGTAECVGAGFENWYEFTPVIKKGKKGIVLLSIRSIQGNPTGSGPGSGNQDFFAIYRKVA